MAIKKRTAKKDHVQSATSLALGIAGGVVANQATNFIEKQSFMQGKEQYAPIATLALGVLGYLFGPDQAKPFFFGMTVVSGTEEVESLISGTGTTSTAPAVQGFYNQLGFTPQYFPARTADSIIRTNEGVAVR